MPADFRYRRNEIRNSRRQDARTRRALNSERRHERVARLDIARHENSEIGGGTEIQGAPAPRAEPNPFDVVIIDDDDDYDWIFNHSFSPVHFESFNFGMDQIFGGSMEPKPCLTDIEIDHCAIDQEDIGHGDPCRRIKKVPTGAARMRSHERR